MSPHIRQPAVAGSFYPSDPSVLTSMLEELFTTASAAGRSEADSTNTKTLKAIIAPHAGYIYSGPIAANAYQCLHKAHDQYDRVLLLGPSHRVAVSGLALSSAQTYLTPLGAIALDLEAIASLQKFNFIEVNDEAHREEHSLEVHLPFLQSTLDHFTLIPIVVGDISPEKLAPILDLFMDDKRTLIVISTDLSHFHDYATAQHRDQTTSDAILDYRYKDIGYGDACGRNPVNAALYWARQHNFSIKLLDLRNSGDTAGDRSRVVGYAAYHIYNS